MLATHPQQSSSLFPHTTFFLSFSYQLQLIFSLVLCPLFTCVVFTSLLLAIARPQRHRFLSRLGSAQLASVGRAATTPHSSPLRPCCCLPRHNATGGHSEILSYASIAVYYSPFLSVGFIYQRLAFILLLVRPVVACARTAPTGFATSLVRHDGRCDALSPQATSRHLV